MKMLYRLGVAVMACATVGCAVMRPRVNWQDQSAIEALISVKADEFKKLTTFTGPNCATDAGDLVYFRAWRDRNNALTYQVYVMDYYTGDWRFYDSAHDEDGVELSFTQIDRQTDICTQYGCSKDEHLGINVGRDYLARHATSGMRFKVSGKRGSEVFVVPAAYIRALLAVTAAAK